MNSLSDRTLEILHHSGWNENRQIDIANYQDLFIRTQQTFSDTVLNFLSSFGGVYVNYPVKKLQTFKWYFYIDPIEANLEMSTEGVVRYIKELNVGLCNIGNVDTESILMTPTGVTYSVFDQYITILGQSGLEAIERICSKQA